MVRHAIILISLCLCWTQIVAQRQLEVNEVNRLEASINSTSEESLPILSPDGRLYFVRTLFDENKGGKFSGQDIWFAEKQQNSWTNASNDLHSLNSKFNNAVIGVADSGRTLYLNGTYSSKPEYQIGVSITQFKNGKWTRPKNLRIKGFNPSNSYMTYYVNGDIGVMLLSFAKNNDPENEDLYVSFLHKGRVWSKPESLGPQINTDQDEFSPFIEKDGKSLFFSSDGHPGKGGVDIFSAYRLDDTWQNWTTVTNLDEPINSAGFDAYFTRSDSVAYFTSNRAGLEMADLYEVDYNVVFKHPESDDPLKDAMTKENLFALKGFLDINNPGRVGMVRVLTPQGDVVQRVKPNNDGSFLITGLDQYKKYSLDLDGQEKEIQDLEIFFVNQNGNRVYLNEGIMDGQYPFETLEKDIRAILMAEVTEDVEIEITQFEFSEEMETPSGSIIYLYDAYGNKQETSVVNRQGEFEFNTMKTGSIYKIELEEGTLDVNSKLYLVNQGSQNEISGNILHGALFKKFEGQLVALDPYSEEGRYAYVRLNGEDTDIDKSISADVGELNAATFGFEYGELPPDGTKVSLVDENGNVVDEAYTDEFGVFKFKKLDPDKKYSMKLENSDDIGRDLSMYILDDDGLKVPIAKGITDGDEFGGSVAVNAEVTEDEQIFSFNYKALPPAGSKVYLTDESDMVIDSTYVDASGNFKFKKLDQDRAYKMRLSDEVDNSGGVDFAIIDSRGGLKKLGYADVEGDRVFSSDGGVAAFDKFAFDYANLPKDGSMVYLTDQNGNILDSSFVDANGNFRFHKLDPNESYLFRVNDEDFDMDAADLFAVEAGQKRKLTKLPNSFAYYSLDLMKVADSKIDMSKFQLDYEGAIPEKAQAYLYDEETNEVVEAADIDEEGNFSFQKLDPERKYQIQFDKEIDETQAKFFVIEEEDVKLDVASALKPSSTLPERSKEPKVTETSPKEDEKPIILSELESEWVVYFGFNEYMLSKEQMKYLQDNVISRLKENEKLVISLEGHADNIGSERANQRISQLRISNVLYHLEIRGFDESRAQMRAYGDSKPIASNDTDDGRSKNKRVEIRIVKN
jgi:outer membrane protein OmpA-like peptidoglycan-associated protein